MKNLKKRVFTHKSKSKIFITILCIFGLLFSWSCSCKNRVSDPNNIPLDNGIKTNKDPDPTPPPTPNNDPDKDLLNGDLSTTSTKVIVVASAGDSIKTTSTIKFKNATAKLTAIADVDASANTTLAVDDFDYTGTTLTFKKDTTDTSKYDATALAKVSWSGEGKKVKATFTLTPTSANATLTKTTQEVEIEIAKIKAINKQTAFGEGLKNLGGGSIQPNATTPGKKNPTFLFETATVDNEKITVKTLGSEDVGAFGRSGFKSEFNNKAASHQNDYFSKVEIVDEGTIDSENNKIATFKLQFTLKSSAADYIELDLGDGSYTLVADLNNYTGNWE